MSCLIWATYNPFPKKLEYKMENTSESRWPLKILECRNVFYPILYLIFQSFRKSKNAEASNFTRPPVVLRDRIILFDKIKINCF